MTLTTVQTIAVGYDGSPHARTALQWTITLARQLGCSVAVVHAVGLLERSRDAYSSQTLAQSIYRIAEQNQLSTDRVHWHAVDGDPCSVLIRSAAPPISAALLVVGSRGESAHGGRLLGSTSQELAEHAPVPLVIVPFVHE